MTKQQLIQFFATGQVPLGENFEKLINQAYLESEKEYVLATRSTDQVVEFGSPNPYLLFDNPLKLNGFMRQNDGSLLLSANKSYILRAQYVIRKQTSALLTNVGLYNRNTNSYFENSIYSVTGNLEVYEYALRPTEDTFVQLRFNTLNSQATVLAGISFIEVKEV